MTYHSYKPWPDGISSLNIDLGEHGISVTSVSRECSFDDIGQLESETPSGPAQRHADEGKQSSELQRSISV